MKTELITQKVDFVLDEVSCFVRDIKKEHLLALAECIIEYKNASIILLGAGRMGMALQPFAMRLRHMGFDAHFYADNEVPHVDGSSLLLVASGSGETASIKSLVIKARELGMKVAAITCKPSSTIACHAMTSDGPVVELPDWAYKGESLQPMTTVNEQAIFLLGDILTLAIMQAIGVNDGDMRSLHSSLE